MAATLFSTYPLLPPEAVAALGPTMVIAPHPDDESLGCGGTLALLRQAGLPVWCVLVTDGTMSHPNSQKFPAPARQALREQELRAALSVLGLAPHSLQTLNLPDGAVPASDTVEGLTAIQHLVQYIRQQKPATVLVPWRRDPHPDHTATNRLVSAAVAQLPQPPRLLEYVVWSWERAAPDELPRSGEVQGWQVSIEPVLSQKQRAIAAHRSQLPGSPIDDDPAGFTLPEGMLAHFAQPVEILLESPSAGAHSSVFAAYEA